MIHDLLLLGLLEQSKRIDNLNLRVTFIDNDSTPVLCVNDFRELGYEYLQFCGESFIRCKQCGRLTRQNKQGTILYCKEHQGYTPKETKVRQCIDCHQAFGIHPKNNKSIRCDSCQRSYDKLNNRLRKQKQREMSR